jgi:RNA polymerase primary sigma factor
MELLDLIQEGNLGLEHAVDKFDWRKGLKFSTYGSYWIRQAVGKALNQKASLIRLPDDAATALRAALRQASGDADQLDDDFARLHRLTTPTSLDRPAGAGDGIELGHLLASDVASPEAVLVEREEREMVDELLATLPARTRLAVEQRFGLADGRRRSYREIGEQLGISPEGARRLIERAIDAVRRGAAAHAPT